ncbi:MAG: glycine cleavage system aminomethyltransferase GcvT [Elusimicrobia bacterium]|nr:glycine cleavage system aminomethyltransferase GcvT [Elusimicrobiota bacterium]
MMKRTPLYPQHKTMGARLIEFGGWEMPVQFQGILAEHKAVREAAGVFDISHMGQVWVTGSEAEGFLQRLVTNDVSKLAQGKGLYALLCREDGTVVDDLYIYRFETDRFFLVVNASRAEEDLKWVRGRLKGDVQILEQPQAAALALQGPKASAILEPLFPSAIDLPRNGIVEISLLDMDFLVSRTGYTGEDGFEIFAPAGHILQLYPRLLEAGAGFGLAPCGLGARDTLRLEMGYRLYGQDLDEKHTGLEAGLGWVIKLDKGDFVGRDVLVRQKAEGPKRRLVAFRLKEKGVPRHGHALSFKGLPVGEVTSGTFSPSLQVGIGMGYVEARAFPKDVEKETGLAVQVHGREIPAEVVALPFYNPKKAVPHESK